MRMSESEYAALIANRGQTKPLGRTEQRTPSNDPAKAQEGAKGKGGKGAIAPGKFQGENLTLILPFKLPTWNALLAMNQWQRAKVRHWLHDAISLLSPTEGDSQILTVSVSKLCSMGLSIEAYYRMITPGSSRKSGASKSGVKRIKR